MATPHQPAHAGLEPKAGAWQPDNAVPQTGTWENTGQDQPSQQKHGNDADELEQVTTAHKAADSSQSVLSHIKLRRVVASELERTGIGAAIIMLDGALSIASVANYIAATYDTNSVYERSQLNFDLALAFFFLFSWVLWFWLDEDKVGYVFSFTTLVDVTTTVPTFLVYGGLALPSLFFLRCLRILRLLRLFRVASISERLANEVFFAATMLGFTLLCMLLIAASVFYELETTYGTAYPDLEFHEAIYWAAVTLTTVGYGDYSPSIWATQLLLLVLLFATFTVLPYLSGKLVDAFNNTSKYERAKYRPAVRTDVTHVVVMGSLDQDNMSNITKEMYHADKAFDNRRTVFLAPTLPSTGMKRVLLATPHFERLAYLQGSPLDSKDLQRAAIEHAEAIFICCNKFALDPATEDRMALMTLLTVGQYLQERSVELAAHYEHSIWRCFLGRLFPSVIKVPKGVPRLFVQLLLPESRQRTQHVLHCLRQPGSNEAVRETATHESDQQPGIKLPIVTPPKDTKFLNSLGLRYGDDFWDYVYAKLSIICLSELRHSFLGHSAVGVPGVIPLLCNLTTTLDYTEALKGKKCGAHAPDWLRNYMTGASQEIYPLVAFPDCLIGASFTEAAAFIYDVTGAVLIATDVDGEAAGRLSISVAPLNAVITRKLCGYIIAPDDVGVHVDLEQADASRLQEWRDRRAHEAALAAAAREATDVDSDNKDVSFARQYADVGNDDDGSSIGGSFNARSGSFVGRSGAADELPYGDVSVESSMAGAPLQLDAEGPDIEAPSPLGSSGALPSDSLPQQQQQQQQQEQQESSARGVKWSPHVSALQHSQSAREVRHAPELALRTMHTSTSMRDEDGSAGRRSTGGTSTSGRSLGGDTNTGRPSFGIGTGAGTSKLRPSGSPLSKGQGSSPRSAQRRHTHRTIVLAKKGIRHDMAPGQGLNRGSTGVGRAGPPLDFLPIHMLRTGSRNKRAAADRVVQEYYHVVPREDVTAPDFGTVSGMLLQHVAFSGHILIVGLPHSLECLFSLLAPFRSRRLSAWRPIVILDQKLPLPGTAWDDIARLKDVFYVQGNVASTDDLLRVNAEGAAKAIILPALIPDHASGAAHAQVALSDEAVVDAYQQLRAINPGIEIYTELLSPSNMAFLRPSQPVPGVGALQESLAPAYVSGQVFQPGMIDTLMAQAFYTRGSDGIVLRLLNQWHVGSAVTSMLHDARQHAKLVAPDELGAAAEAEVRQHVVARAPTVLQVHVPARCIAERWHFSRFWLHMLQQEGMLVLGLYRPVVQQGRTFCAVLTNPDKDLTLAAGDRAFVIYDLTASQQLPPEVLGFDHDLPPSGEEGPGGPAIMGTAASTAGKQDSSIQQHVQRQRDNLGAEGYAFEERRGWGGEAAASRQGSMADTRQQQFSGTERVNSTDAHEQRALVLQEQQQAQQQAQQQLLRRVQYQQDQQQSSQRMSVNMPFMGSTRVNANFSS